MLIRFVFHGEHDLRFAALGPRRAVGEHVMRVKRIGTCCETIDAIREYHGITPEYHVTIIVAGKEIAQDVRVPEACFSETVREGRDPDLINVLIRSNVWITLVLNDYARSMPNAHPEEHARSIRKSHSLECFAMVARGMLGFVRGSEVIVTADTTGEKRVHTQYDWAHVGNHSRVTVRLAGFIRPDFPPPDPECLKTKHARHY